MPLCTRDGRDALDQVAVAQPALIWLASGMPRLDGFGFAEELTQRGLRAGRAILVLTANNRARARAERIGAEDISPNRATSRRCSPRCRRPAPPDLTSCSRPA